MTIDLKTTLHGTDGSSTFEFIDVLPYQDLLVTVTQEPKIRIYESDTGKVAFKDTLNSFGVFSGISLIAPACAVITNSSNQSIYFVDLSSPTYFRNFLTNGQISRSSAPNNYSQIVAGKPDLKLAMYCRQSAGVQLVNANTWTTTSLSPPQLSPNISLCVINKDNSNNWLVGTTSGTIVEIASSGSVIQSIALPVTPVADPPMTTGKPYVHNLVSTGNYVVASSPRGLYLLDWAASAVLDIVPCKQTDTGYNGMVLSNAASGFFLAGTYSNSSWPASITEYYITKNRLTKDNQLLLKTSSGPVFSGIKIDYSKNRAYMPIDATTYDNFYICDISPPNLVNISTKVQDASVDVAARIIRIRDSEFIGRSEIELDEYIPLEGGTLPSINGKSYIEIAIKEGSPEKYDIREFLA